MLHLRDFIPPILLNYRDTFYANYKYMMYRNKNIFRNNLNLENCGKGKRAFILATGPSIKKEDLSLLSKEDCFSVSNFFLHKNINEINPKMHFFAPYHEPLILENYVEWLAKSDTILPITTDIVLGHKTKDMVEKFNLFKYRQVRYLYLTYNNTLDVDITKNVLGPQTGPLMILPVLIYMGYNQIYLLGCDHNTLKYYGGTVENFYEADMDIRKNAINKWDSPYNELMCTMNVFKQYEYYAKIADKKGIKIINLSMESWLEIFPKNRLSNIL